jgi:lactoylglutathione lyase
MTEKEEDIIPERKNNDTNSKDSLVLSLVNNFRDAFNSHDPKIFASLLVEDAEWTDVTGTTMVGKEEIKHQHTYPFQTVLKEATLDVISFKNKWIDDKIVSIEIRWESIDHRTPEGAPIPTSRHGLLNLIAKKIDEKRKESTLKIVSAHNNDYTSTFTQSDRKKVIDMVKYDQNNLSKLPDIEGLFETHLTVNNLEKSISFYRDVIGLQVGIKVPEHNCAFLWVGGPKRSMLGLWSTGLTPLGLKLHIAFKVNIKDLINIPDTLRSKGITPLNMFSEEADDPTVIPFIPSASIFFHDPDGHLLEYLALLDEEPRPNLRIVTWSAWVNEKNKVK